MAPLRVGQIQVERTQVNQGFVLEKRLGQEPEPLAGSRFHEGGHQKQVSQRADSSPVPEAPFTKRANIAVGSRLGEDSPPLLDEIQDLAEVPHLLVGKCDHSAHESRMIRKPPDQGDRGTGRLLLTVGVINQELVESSSGNPHPLGRRGQKQGKIFERAGPGKRGVRVHRADHSSPGTSEPVRYRVGSSFMKLAAYIAAAFQTLIAAGTFLVAKDATDRFTPLELSWFRIMISAWLVLVVYRAVPRHRPRPDGKDIVRFALLGLSGVTLNQMCFLFGIHLSTPLHASLLYAFTPVLVLGGAVAHLGERLTWIKGTGVAMAVLGVTCVLVAHGLDLAGGPFRGDLIIMVAVFGWTTYTLLGKPVLERYDPFTVITWSFGFGALSLLPLTPWVLSGFDPAGPGLQGWAEMLYLSAITSGVAFTLWYYALRRLEATQLAVFTNLQAPLTALLAWLILGSVPESLVVAGGILVIAGVTVVQIPRLRARAGDPA